MPRIEQTARLFVSGREDLQTCLGLGSAYGDEFLPIIKRIKQLTILDPSDAFQINDLKGVPVTYDKPHPSGDLPFAEASVDLITCFGVLHHIPNVTHVIREMGRCLAPGGIALIREPSVSMGDWTQPRAGLTRRERGIPTTIMRSAISDARLEVVRQTPYGFAPATRAWYLISRSSFYNYGMAVALDVLLSRLTSWNHRYHRKTILNRFSPSSVFWVLTKNAGNMR
ncbi:MAG TPA: hypothetical protein DD979_18735 [Gammaproteobacteria bacterium]|nr:hypothetical protein [Gammaproteobacteria bacterium]